MSSLSDRYFVDLAGLPIHSMVTTCGAPVSKEITMKIMNKKYLGIEADIVKQQRETSYYINNQVNYT